MLDLMGIGKSIKMKCNKLDKFDFGSLIQKKIIKK
jgi:hypothetical protein